MSSRRNVLAGILLHWFIAYVPMFMMVVFSMMDSASASNDAFLLIFPLHVLTMVLTFAGWIWMIVHAMKNPEFDGNDRVFWALALFLGGQLGALAYFWLKFRHSSD